MSLVAELIVSSKGLGFLIDSRSAGRTDNLPLAIPLLALFGKTADAALGLVELGAVRNGS